MLCRRGCAASRPQEGRPCEASRLASILGGGAAGQMGGLARKRDL